MRYTLPAERRKPWLQRGTLASTALLVPCLAGYLWQGFVHHVWGASLLILFMAIGFAGGFYEAVTTREFYTRNGDISRKLHPFAYWLCTLLTLGLYVATIWGMFFAGPFSLSRN